MGDIYWRFVAALALVVALIFACAWIAKRLGLGGRMATPRGKRRLSIQEVLPLDGKRRLVLVKRDEVEHLVVIGLNSDLVVETGINARAARPEAEFGAMLPGASA